MQLKPTKKQLKEIGFKKKIVNADELNPARIIYELKGKCNDCIYYNYDLENKYKWYYQTTIGENSNFIHLEIKDFPTLYTILSAFMFKFEFRMYY